MTPGIDRGFRVGSWRRRVSRGAVDGGSSGRGRWTGAVDGPQAAPKSRKIAPHLHPPEQAHSAPRAEAVRA